MPAISHGKESLPERRHSEASPLGLMFLFAVVLVTYACIAVGGEGHGSNVLVSVSFVVNGVIGICFLTKASQRHAYSIEIAHWIFYILFFSLAPFLQFQSGVFPWSWTFDDSTVVMGNILVFCWGIVVGLICNRKKASEISAVGYPVVSRTLLVTMLGISVLVLVYMVATVGFSDMLSRSTNEIEIESSAIRQLVEKICRATVTFTCVASMLYYKRTHTGLALVVLSLAICAIVCAPTGMPRYSTAAVWGSILIVSFGVFNRKIIFTLFFFWALLLIFPAINIFKEVDYYSADLVSSFVSVAGSIPASLLEVSYDTYSILLRTIDYVESHGVSLGYQLLGALLFFVPRTLWASKPFGSGAVVVAAQGQTVTNVACPLPGEGIINFGIVGFFLFAILAGIFISRCDMKYWCSSSRSLFLQVFYPQLVFFFFFIMRGDLMSSLAYTVAFGAMNFVWAKVNNMMLAGSTKYQRPRFHVVSRSGMAVENRVHQSR